MECLEIDSLDPAFNLALEEQLLRSLPLDHPGYFLLWQNSPSIIIGRHQCAAEVVNAAFAAENGLPVIRRMTGGGAVYHDEGNLNFSFITRAGKKPDFAFFLKPVCGALARLGARARISGRNDLEIDGLKISGSGQLFLDGKILHHGTLLVSMNLERMASALRVDEAKFKSKGVPSLRSRVANLRDFIDADMRSLKNALSDACSSAKGAMPPEILDAAARLAIEKYSSRDWNYGRSPGFNLEKRARFPWGEVIARLDARGDRICACKIHGDFFNSAPIVELENALLNAAFEPQAFAQALAHVEWEKYFLGCRPQTMRDFFTRELFA